ncbi:hypothetical protein [Streptomyces sp. NPDC003247]
MHLEERSGNQADGPTAQQRRPPTGIIWMEREPEVTHYRALLGQGFGVVG